MIEHTPDKSDTSNGNISLVDDLRHYLIEKYYSLHDYGVRLAIQEEIGADNIFGKDYRPKPGYLEQVEKILGRKVNEEIQNEFAKRSKSWKRVVEFHNNLKLEV